MEKKIYNKLVRDKIPDLIKSDSCIPKIQILNQADYLKYLYKKLKEELEEFLSNEDIEELADLYEVMLAILKSRQISVNEFEAIRLKKVQERGAFDQKILLISVEK